MLGQARAAVPEELTGRLIAEPPAGVGRSVLPFEDPERAAAEAARSAIRPDLLARFGATVRQTHRRAGVIVIDVPAERREALAAALEAAGIPAREPHPVDPLLDRSVPALAVPAVWAAGLRGAGVRVAIVDTGIDRTHPDLRDRVALTADFAGGGPADQVGHGTHVAGIVAGSGTVYRGVAPEATLVVARALGPGGGGEDAVLAALSWASRQDVQVLNLSLGGPGSPVSPLSREVDALAREGILVCVAAGNAGPATGTIGSPGDARGAITVGALDRTGALASYSSRGPVPGVHYRKPDLVAVGGGVTERAACSYGTGIASARAGLLAGDPCAVPPRYVRMSGTSMAAPHVAGVCALLVEALGGGVAAPARARLIRAALLRTARPVAGAGRAGAGAGVIDAERALAALRASAGVAA